MHLQKREGPRYMTAEADGRPLLEVFSVRFHGGGTPIGTVSVFDGKRGQNIYNRSRDQPASPVSSSRLEDGPGLVLTGPYRAISADGCVAIILDLHDRCQEAISLDIYESGTQYDKAITRRVYTCDGHADVTYAVLSDAVEATVEVKLLRPRDEAEENDPAPACVHGRIVARSELLDTEVVLLEDVDECSFYCEDEPESESDDENISPRSHEPTVPLTRSVLAVPLVSPLTIKVDLRAHSGDKIVEDSLECSPVLDGGPVRHPVGRNGEVEVKITWLD